MRLQHRPCQIVVVLADPVREAGEISFESCRQRHGEDVGLRQVLLRAPYEADRSAVRGIHSLARSVPVLPRPVAALEARTLQRAPTLWHAMRDGDLVSILQVASHAVELELQFDAVASDFIRRADA